MAPSARCAASPVIARRTEAAISHATAAAAALAQARPARARAILAAALDGTAEDLELLLQYAEVLSLDGYVDGELRLTAASSSYLSPEHSPFVGKSDSSWDIQIEGRPTSVKCTVAVQASFRDNMVFYDGDTTSPMYHATAAVLVQAIPVVVGHEPGIVYPSVFASCTPDLRMLENRKSLVD